MSGGVRVPVPVILMLVLILTAIVLDGLWRERSRRCLAWTERPQRSEDVGGRQRVLTRESPHRAELTEVQP